MQDDRNAQIRFAWRRHAATHAQVFVSLHFLASFWAGISSLGRRLTAATVQRRGRRQAVEEKRPRDKLWKKRHCFARAELRARAKQTNNARSAQFAAAHSLSLVRAISTAHFSIKTHCFCPAASQTSTVHSWPLTRRASASPSPTSKKWPLWAGQSAPTGQSCRAADKERLGPLLGATLDKKVQKRPKKGPKKANLSEQVRKNVAHQKQTGPVCFWPTELRCGANKWAEAEAK